MTRESVRKDKEERLLWRMLGEIDKEDAQVEKKVKLKIKRKSYWQEIKWGQINANPVFWKSNPEQDKV